MSLNNHLIQKENDISLGDGVNNSIEMAAGICYSARIILYNIYACNESYAVNRPRIAEETEMQRASIEGLKEITQGVYHIAQQISSTAMSDDLLLSQSPVLLHCLYEASTELAWFIREDNNIEGVVAFNAIVKVLKAIGLRWQVAGELS